MSFVGYKWTTAEALSWHDNKFGPWRVGKTLSVADAKPGDACGNGLHIGKTPEHAISYGRFPGRLFEVRGVGPVLGEDETKARFAKVKVLAEIEKPWWILETEAFIASISEVPWFKPQRKPRKTWKHHPTRDAAGAAAGDAAWAAAGDAAGAAARDAAGDAAWDAARATAWAAARAAAGAAAGAAADAAGAAAWDAALQASMAIVSDLKFKNKTKHVRHAQARWDVWTSGYGLVCDVNGRLYTYERP